MRFIPALPPADLAADVIVCWQLYGRTAYRAERVLPNGVVELIFNLGGPQLVVDETSPGRDRVFRDAWVAGLQQGPLTIGAVTDTRLLGIRFSPLGARRCLGLPLGELTDRVVTAADLGDRAATVALDRMRHAVGPARRFQLAWALVRGYRDRPDPVQGWLRAAVERLRGFPVLTVSGLCRELGYSSRYVNRCFHEHLGLAPKTFQRIQRFDAVIREVGRARKVRWADVAARFGYADQAHLVREFRLLADVTPGDYLRARNSNGEHVILD